MDNRDWSASQSSRGCVDGRSADRDIFLGSDQLALAGPEALVLFAVTTDDEPDVTVAATNEQYRDLAGLARGAGHSRDPTALFGAERGSAIVSNCRRCIERGDSVEYEGVPGTADVDGHWYTRFVPLSAAQSTAWIVAISRRRAKTDPTHQLTVAEFRQIVDLIPDLLLAKNRGGEFLLANEAFASMHGCTPEEMEGKTDREIGVDEETAAKFRADDLSVIESGEPMERVEETITTDAGETRILQTTKIPYEPVGTDETAVLAYARDVTELKEYERQLEAQRNNLELLNEVVRHDIRNDLQLIQAYAELATEHVDDEGVSYLETIIESAENAITLTQTARELAAEMAESATTSHRIPLSGVLTQQLREIRSAHPNADVSVAGFLPDVGVRADGLLGAVFRNLLENAIQHNDTEIPVVTISAETTDDVVTVRIADNGPGVPESRREEIFYKREKGDRSDGTGIGLYLVSTLLGRYGGEIWVEDADLGGAAFVVELSVE
ncbi:PAS domain-containing sensor histidine kinase [Halobacteria archaeon AArc-dxtr1]|nr:PAS domain-containing sensor histidine kinase [Halobacteria archaeon AArc-dxtr1]